MARATPEKLRPGAGSGARAARFQTTASKSRLQTAVRVQALLVPACMQYGRRLRAVLIAALCPLHPRAGVRPLPLKPVLPLPPRLGLPSPAQPTRRRAHHYLHRSGRFRCFALRRLPGLPVRLLAHTAVQQISLAPRRRAEKPGTAAAGALPQGHHTARCHCQALGGWCE